MRAQAQHFIEGKPFGPATCLGPALWQIRVLFEHAAEMPRGNGDQVTGDFPSGEKAQRPHAIFFKTATGQIGATGFAGACDTAEIRRCGGGAKRIERCVGMDVKIGGEWVILCHVLPGFA